MIEHRVAAFGAAQEIAAAIPQPTSDIVAVRCDVCGGACSTGGRLALSGQGLTVDLSLCEAHVVRLTRRVRRWVQRPDAHAAPIAEAAPATGRRLRDGESTEQIRAWARQRGLGAARKGSLSVAVIAAYREAHPDDA